MVHRYWSYWAMSKEIKSEIAKTIKKLYAAHDGTDSSIIEVNRTSDNSHGDLYTNVAMKLAKILKKKSLIDSWGDFKKS